MIERLAYTLASNGIPVDRITGTQNALNVEYMASATAQHRASGQTLINSFDWSQAAEDAWRLQRKREATRQEALGAENKTLRMILPLLVKEINALRARMVPAMPPRTVEQVRNALMQAINNGEAD